jgi:hypothetical protein
MSDRQLCCPESPMPKDAPGRWEHTNVEEVGEQENGWPGGDYQHYRCKDCGHVWEEELPQ